MTGSKNYEDVLRDMTQWIFSHLRPENSSRITRFMPHLILFHIDFLSVHNFNQ